MKHDFVNYTLTTGKAGVQCTQCDSIYSIADMIRYEVGKEDCITSVEIKPEGLPSLQKQWENVQNAAMKFDDNKTRWDLLPPEALDAVADILTFGAKKYSKDNWRKGMTWSRLFGAMCRHMWAFWRGEGIDPESKRPHLAHAACNALMLLQYSLMGEGTDDRYKK